MESAGYSEAASSPKPVTVTIAGVVDIPQADTLFQNVGAVVGAPASPRAKEQFLGQGAGLIDEVLVGGNGARTARRTQDEGARTDDEGEREGEQAADAGG